MWLAPVGKLRSCAVRATTERRRGGADCTVQIGYTSFELVENWFNKYLLTNQNEP